MDGGREEDGVFDMKFEWFSHPFGVAVGDVNTQQVAFFLPTNIIL